MTATRVQVAQRDSPYFGLDYYDEKFGAWFFGREADGSKIITNLRAARLTLLHAESGVGKTSLLRAGVAWRLHRLADDMFARGRSVRSIPVVFSSWKDDPATELATAVGAAIRPYLSDGQMPPQADPRLDAAVAAASDAANATLCIMLDQFEEYFLYRSREPVPERFADELARCVNRTDLRANFLIAIREDAYAELGDLFKGRITNVYGNYLHIDYLDRTSAEKAIRGPVEVYNSQPGVVQPVTVQDELVAAVLDEVRAWGGSAPTTPADGDRDRIATPLLQLVMQRVWDAERAEGSHQLRLSTLQQLRGVKTIVDDHLGKALGSLSGAERGAAIDMFEHLVTPSGGKIAESVSDLAKRTGRTEDHVDGVLRRLDDKRILRPVPAAPGQDPVRSRRYEIFHDVLASPINRAIAAREEQRRVRRFRRLAALAVALLVIVSAVAVVFAYLLNSANNEKLTAESRELAADADLNLARDPELSTSLALQALKLSPTSQAADALRATLPELQLVKTFHNGTGVSWAAFDPADANIMASIDNSGVVRIWDTRTGRPLSHPLVSGYEIYQNATVVAFNPAGTKVAIGYQSGTVELFDARTGQLQGSDNPGPYISGLGFAGSASELAIAVSGSNAVLWHYDTTRCCDTKLNAPGDPEEIAVNPHDADEVVETTSDGVFIVTVNHSGKPHPALRLLGPSPSDVQFSPDGSEVIATGADGTVSIYRVATRKIVTTLPATGIAATDAAFSPDGKQVVAGYQDGTGRIWDVATGLQLTLLSGHTGSIISVRFSSDGREIATASADGTVRVWYAQPRELRTEFAVTTNGGPSSGLYYSEYISDRIITTDASGNVFVYSPSGQLQATIKTGSDYQQISWDQAGKKILAFDFNDSKLELWQATGLGYRRVPIEAGLGLDPSSEAYGVLSPDGSRLAFVLDGPNASFPAGLIQIQDLTTGKVLRNLSAGQSIGAVVLSPDGQQVVGTDQDGQIEFWNGKATKPQVLSRPGPALAAIDFNRSGTEFVAASAGGMVTVWSAPDGRLMTSINACPSPNSAAFNPDGSKVAVACSDGTVRVFDASTGRTLTVIQAASAGSVSDAGFSPDGKSIVAGVNAGRNEEVQIWNAELATSSLPTLERLAEQRIGDKLTAAQLQQYLSGAS